MLRTRKFRPTDKVNSRSRSCFGTIAVFGFFVVSIVVFCFRYEFGQLALNCNEQILASYPNMSIELTSQEDTYHYNINQLVINKWYKPGKYFLVLSSSGRVIGLKYIEIKPEQILNLNVEDLIQYREPMKQRNQQAKASIN